MRSLTGISTFLRLGWRRDRVLLPAWLFVIVSMAAFSGSAGKDLFPTLESRQQAAAAINNSPAFVALLGRVYDPNSIGALSLIKLTTFGAAMVAILAIILVIRHTRREEESGRLELLGANVVGRRAALTAALTIAVGSMILLGALTAVLLSAVGLPASGAWAFGLAWATTGIAFAAVAALTAQLTTTSRSATGIALAFLAAAYTVRALGDAGGTADGPDFWSWLSPIGWGQQVRPFAGDHWAVLALPVAFTIVAIVGAFLLAERRDLGAGILPEREGTASVSETFASPLALAWRLQRGLLLWWLMGYVLVGFVYGNMASDVGSFLSSDQLQDYFRRLGGNQGLTDAFFSAEFGLLALLTAAYGVTVTLHLRSEEESGHTENILSTAVPRSRWLASHVIIAIVGTTVLTVVAGVASAAANAIAIDGTAGFGRIVGGTLVYLPAAWLFVGLTVLLFGIAPRLSSAAWGALVACVVVGELGALLGLPDWVINLSPFTHIPKLPGTTLTWTPIVALTLIALALMAAGAAGFNRRDTPST